MLTIDGSQGEGGGQVLRTSLAMSLVTGQPFRIEGIRARRAKPGLMRQHLTSVEAAAKIGGADVSGAAIGALELSFKPQTVRPGDYHFSIGTAGSTTLVLQTVLPALMIASGPSTLTLEGGTHNPLAPPFEFLQRSFLPLVNRMGPKVTARLDRPGFYPAGGGKLTVTVEPAATLAGFDLLERGELIRCRALAIVSAVPRHIAERELAVVAAMLGRPSDDLEVEEVKNPRGPGNVLLIEIGSANVTEVFAAFGERGVRAETVAQKAVADAEQYLASDVAIGEHLADQLLVPLAIAGRGSFTTFPLSSHATTNIQVLMQFLAVEIKDQIAGESTRSRRITVERRPHSG